MKHIVFSGQLANGKDVLADITKDILNGMGGPLWKRSAFAGAVKDIYCHAFDVDRDFIEKWKRNPEPPPGFLMNVRKSLQFIGDGFRAMQSEVWINLALRDEYLILSDGRYINEARAAKKLGGANILVWRPGFENNDPNMSEAQILPIVRWCLATNQNGPIKENLDVEPVEGIENYDYFFRNDLPIDALETKARRELIPWLRDR
jgi:hypothetical protein